MGGQPLHQAAGSESHPVSRGAQAACEVWQLALPEGGPPRVSEARQSLARRSRQGGRLDKRQGFLNAHAAADMLAWENSGFSIDASVRITLFRPHLRVSCQSLEHLLRYCARPASGVIELSPFEFLAPACGSHPTAAEEPASLSRSVCAEPPAAESRHGSGGKVTSGSSAMPRHSGHASDDHATGGCGDANQKPRSHDTSRIAWAKLMATSTAFLGRGKPGRREQPAHESLSSRATLVEVPLTGLSFLAREYDLARGERLEWCAGRTKSPTTAAMVPHARARRPAPVTHRDRSPPSLIGYDLPVPPAPERRVRAASPPHRPGASTCASVPLSSPPSSPCLWPPL